MTADAEPIPEAPRPRRPRTLRWVLLAFFGALGLFGLALLYIAVHLAFRPVESDRVARIAESVVSDTLGGGRPAQIGRARITGSPLSGLAIQLTDIRVGDAADGLAIEVPEALIGIQMLSLITGTVRAHSLELDSPRILIDLPALDRRRAALDQADRPSGGTGDDPPLAVGQGGAATSSPGSTDRPPVAAPPAAAPAPGESETIASSLILTRLDAFGRALSRNARLMDARGLERAVTRRGEITLVRADGQGGTKRVVIPDIETTTLFGTEAGTVDMGFSARGEIGRWSMRVRHVTAADGTRHSLVFNAEDVTLRDIVGPIDPPFRVEMPFYPSVSVDYDRDDRLVGASVDLKVGAGILRFGKVPEDEVLIDEGQVVVAWDRTAERFAVQRAAVQVGPTSVAVKGWVAPPKTGEGERWTVSLTHESGQFNPRDVGGQPVDLISFLLQGHYDGERRVLHIEDLQAQFTGGALRSVGHIDFAQTYPLATINTVFAPIGAGPLSRVWPHFLAAGARKWFIEQVTAGRVSDVLIKTQVPLGVDPPLWPPGAVTMTGKFDRGTVKILGELPPVVGAEGSFKLANKRLEVVVDRAAVATRHPKRPELVSFKLDMADAIRPGPRGVFDFRVTGETAALAEIVDAEPLKVLENAGLKSDGVTGTGDVKARFEMTFEQDPKPETFDYRFDVTLDKFGSPNPILGRRFAEGNLKVTVDRNGTTVVGKAKVDGVATDLNMFEPAGGSKAAERREFGMVLDDAARQRMGLDLAGMVAGPIKVEIGQGATEQVRRINADLSAARLVIPQFGWTKGAGVAAKASLDLIDDEKGTRIDNFVMESEGLQVRGSMTVDKDKRLSSGDFSRFALRRGDDARIRLQRGADQALSVNFEASSFDIRSLLQSLKKQGDAPSVDPKKQSDMIIKARAARLVGFNDIALTDVVIDATIRNQTVTRLQLSGRAPGGRAIEIAIRPEGGRRIATMTTDNAGAALGFLDIYERLRGGSLALTADLGAQGSADGVLRIVGFGLAPNRNERVQVRTTSDGLREVLVREAPITEEGLFDRFSVGFRMRAGVITLNEGIAKGPATGATMGGQIDLNNQRLTVTGTFIPLYGLNNLVSRIPLLGEIAGAGRNEGLVGVTFRVVGPIENPVLQFNPISAIAPGIFRRIFEYRVEDGSQAEPQPNRVQ